MTIYGIWLLRKELRSAPNGWPSIRIVAAGLLMVAGTWWLRDMFIPVPIIVGAVIYSGAIVVLKVIPKEDRDMFGSMLQSLVAGGVFWHGKTGNIRSERIKMKFWRRMVREESEHKLLSLALNAEDGTTLMTFPGEVVQSVRRTISRLITKKTLPARIALVSSLRQEGMTYLSRALATTLANDLDANVCAVELNWWVAGQLNCVAR